MLLGRGDEREDGLLQPREIAELDLSGRAVILSACSTAGGTVLQGEGVMGLARAFFQAGAHAVIGSLWPLRDDEAARLVGDVSDHLAGGASLGQALASTRREWIRAGRPTASWAGVVLLGDGDLVPVPRGGSGRFAGWLAPALGLALLASLAAWIAVSRRRGRAL